MFIARRLRWTLREMHDFRDLAVMQTQVKASIYGNPQLDAVKGFNELSEAVTTTTLPYMRKKSRRRRQPLSDEGMLAMLKEIKKRFSGEKAKTLHEERMRRLGIVEAPGRGG